MDEIGAILDNMKSQGMQTPSDTVKIEISNAKGAFSACFQFMINNQCKKMVWLPEYEHVVNWLENNNGRGLFMTGTCGRGKSLIGRFVLPALLLKYCRKVVSVYDTNYMNANIDEILKKHIIYLDDIGTEEISVKFGERRSAFAEIVDAAEKQGKLLIISTNLKSEPFSEKYGGRTLDRIIAITKIIKFEGESLRK